MRNGCQAILGLAAFVLMSLTPYQVSAQSDELTRNYQRGSSLFEAGMYKASAPYFVKALELSEAEYGRDSSRTAFILKNLATVYAKQGAYETAEPLYVRALGIFEKAFGPDHGLVAEVTNELSIVYVERKRFIEAEPLLGRVLENLERTFGPDDSRVAVAAYNYGYASEFLGDSHKARTLYARALQIWQSQPVPDDTRIRAARERLAALGRVRETRGPSLAPYLPKVLPSRATKAPEVPVAVAPAPAQEAKAEIGPASAPAAKRTWRVQLAAFRSLTAAEKELDRVRTSFASAVDAPGDPIISEAVLPKGTFYRLVFESFQRRETAVTFCENLKAKDQSCIVVRQK